MRARKQEEDSKKKAKAAGKKKKKKRGAAYATTKSSTVTPKGKASTKVDDTLKKSNTLAPKKPERADSQKLLTPNKAVKDPERNNSTSSLNKESTVTVTARDSVVNIDFGKTLESG